jgi:site-specific DNA-adenine methylase
VRYQGSNLRTAPALASVLQAAAELASAPRVEELFCGSAAVSRELYSRGLVVDAIQDARPAVIACYREIRDGWVPPTSLTREEYAEIRARFPDDTATDPLAAFALVFCSYGGAWAGGHIADDTRWSGEKSDGRSRSAAKRAHLDLLSMVPLLRRTTIWCGDYRERAEERPPGTVMIADPPYWGTKTYKGRGPFDHAAFWAWAAAASRRHFLLVTEDTVPPEWRVAVRVLVQSPGLRRAQRIETAHVLRGGMLDQLMLDHPHRAAFTLHREVDAASCQASIFTAEQASRPA